MINITDKLNRLFRIVVVLLFGIFVSYLSLLSLFSTNYTYVGIGGVFVSDTPFKALFFYILIVIICFLYRKYKVENFIASKRKQLFAFIYLLLFVFLSMYVLSTQLAPHGDQLAICNAAVGLRHYDFSLFTKGNYFDFWPFQSRIVVFLWGFFAVFGESNYLAFQMMNVVCIVISLCYIAKITALVEKTGKCSDLAVLLASASFIPFLLYVTYIYGNVIGFSFMMAAIYQEMKYLDTHKMKFLFGTVILCAIGVWLKNTYQIIMIAMLVFLLVDFWQNFKVISLAGILAILAAVSMMGMASDAVLENRLGFQLSKGTPMTAWITMAFGEDDLGNPVKYDAYNMDVYLENEMDYDKVEAVVKEELRSRLESLTDTPSHFIRFMGKKIAFEWNEPTFESLVANNRDYPGVEEPAWVKLLLREDNRNAVVKYLNLFHALVLLGCVSWVFLEGRKAKPEQLIFAVIFVGGFLFQLFWETLSQYTLMYFLLLIPYAVSGYRATAAQLDYCMLDKKVCKKTVIGYGAVGLLILAVGLTKWQLVHDLFKLDQDNLSYTKHIQEIIAEEQQKIAAISDGHYVVTPKNLPGYGIGTEKIPVKDREAAEEPIPVELKPVDEENTGILEIVHEYTYDLLRIQSTQLLLSISDKPESGNAQVGQDYDEAMWKIIEMKENGYAITYEGGYALTYSEETKTLSIEPYTGADNQCFLLEPR